MPHPAICAVRLNNAHLQAAAGLAKAGEHCGGTTQRGGAFGKRMPLHRQRREAHGDLAERDEAESEGFGLALDWRTIGPAARGRLSRAASLPDGAARVRCGDLGGAAQTTPRRWNATNADGRCAQRACAGIALAGRPAGASLGVGVGITN